MPNQYLNPAALFPSRQYGFSQGVVSDRPRLGFLSGQVAWDAGQRLGPAADLGQQLRRALDNVETALHEALRGLFHPERLPAEAGSG